MPAMFFASALYRDHGLGAPAAPTKAFTSASR